MMHTLKRVILASVLCSFWGIVYAENSVKPFILVESSADGSFQEVSAATRTRLQQADFEVLGEYAPYADANVIAFTSPALQQLATRSKRGGYGAVLRASVTRNGDVTELAYTNPEYWINAYRMEAEVEAITESLKAALGTGKSYGTGDLNLSAGDMREYHYTFMMEYFDDPSILNYYDSHEQAVTTIKANLASGVGASVPVYQVSLAPDSNGKQMTLFGVGLRGEDADDCSSDSYIMDRIDKESPRHTAHLPYEILVYGDHAEALYARFRIAISWPHLPMLASDTGATFFSIMCAPGAIERALTAVAGGKQVKRGEDR